MMGFIYFISLVTVIFIFAIIFAESKREEIIKENLKEMDKICDDIHSIINK